MDRRLSIGIRAAWQALLIAVGLCVLTWAANKDLSPPPGAQPMATFGQFLVAGLFVWAVAFILLAGVRLLLTGRKVSGSPTGADASEAWEDTSPSTVALREHIPQHIKDQVWRRHQGRCAWCQSDYRVEFDHIQPLIAGGRSNYRNLRLLCERCNREKGAGW